VLGREPKSHQVVVDTYDDCINTRGVVSGLKTLLKFPDLDSGRALIGAMKLNREEIVLTTQPLQAKLKIDDYT